MGSHCLLQGIFLTQGSNPSLLHFRQSLLSELPPYHHTKVPTLVFFFLILTLLILFLLGSQTFWQL